MSSDCSVMYLHSFKSRRYNKTKTEILHAKNKIFELEIRNNALSASLQQFKLYVARLKEEEKVIGPHLKEKIVTTFTKLFQLTEGRNRKGKSSSSSRPPETTRIGTFNTK